MKHVKLDGSPDEIVRVPHVAATPQQLKRRGLVPTRGGTQMAIALTGLGIYACTSQNAAIHTTPDGAEIAAFLLRCGRLLDMTPVQLSGFFVHKPERMAEMRALFNLDASRDDLQAFLDATPGGKLIKELKAEGL